MVHRLFVSGSGNAVKVVIGHRNDHGVRDGRGQSGRHGGIVRRRADGGDGVGHAAVGSLLAADGHHGGVEGDGRRA